MGVRILDEIWTKLDPRQFGSIKDSSTTHALIDILHFWHSTVHARKLVRVVFLDYSKPFDQVSHSTLIEKFKKLGLSPTPLTWLCGYLSNRQQHVKLGLQLIGNEGSDATGLVAGATLFYHLPTGHAPI